ncbi:DUF397 domain-containing protein [Mangrovihabitans endophyticus]|nr:DUF397 domain-containing protein [Mangrovihabitans endophyticus]
MEARDLHWRRACASGACIEVARRGDEYLLRDSKDPDAVLCFSEQEWFSFVAAVRAGELDL